MFRKLSFFILTFTLLSQLSFSQDKQAKRLTWNIDSDSTITRLRVNVEPSYNDIAYTTAYITGLDTARSSIFHIGPYHYFDFFAADTAGDDSLNLVAQLYSADKDQSYRTSGWVSSPTAPNDADFILVDSLVITSSPQRWILHDSPYANAEFAYFLIVGRTGNSLVTPVSLYIKSKATEQE